MRTHDTSDSYKFEQTNKPGVQLSNCCTVMRATFSVSLIICIVGVIGCRPSANRSNGDNSMSISQNAGESNVKTIEMCGPKQSSAILSLMFIDNDHLCAGSSDGMLQLFDLHANKRRVRFFDAGGFIAGLHFMPSMNELITAHIFTLSAWKYPECSKGNDYYKAFPYVFLAFSDGKAIFVDSDKGNILLLDIASKQIRTILSPLGNLNGINTAAYFPKCKFLVAGGAAGVLRRLDVGKVPTTVRFNCHLGSPIFSVAVSPDGDIIAVTTSDKTVRILNAENGSVIRNLMISSDGVDQLLLFSNEGEVLITIEPVADNCQPSLIRFWNVKNGTEMWKPLLGHKSRIKSACLSPDNSLLATGSLDGSIIVWKLGDRMAGKEKGKDKGKKRDRDEWH